MFKLEHVSKIYRSAEVETAAPLTYLFMQRWLEGFAYHVDQNPMVFVAAGVLALIIALATVAGHALLVARAKPVEALQYE